MIKSPQFWAGKLLGFYEAGDNILSWMNSVDSSEMSVKDFRKALTHKILEMKLRTS